MISGEESSAVDEEEAFDFTSPVKRLVERSRHYFSGIQDSVETGQSGKRRNCFPSLMAVSDVIGLCHELEKK